MTALGGRHPMEANWIITSDASTHKITDLTITVNVDCGFSTSSKISATSLNAYVAPTAKLTSNQAETHTPINTIMRAPGEFSGALFMEASMEAGLLSLSSLDRRNTVR